MIGDSDRGTSNSTSVDNASLHQLFTDVARRLLAADTGRSSSTCREKEPDSETERSTNNISTLIESNFLRRLRFPSSVSSWLEQRRLSIHDVDTLSTESQTSTSLQQGSCNHDEEQPCHNGLQATGVDHSSRPQRRLAEQNVVDGRQRPQSPVRNDIDAISCYFDEESESKADDGGRVAWSTGLYLGKHDDGRDESPASHLNPSYRLTTCNLDDEKDYRAAEADPVLLWRLARPLTG